MKNVFYFQNINEIGGIETWLYNISQLYGDEYDINIFYKIADDRQLERLRRKAKVYQYIGQEIECEKAFFCFNMDIASKVKAKEKYFFIHGDYKAQKVLPKIDESITKVFAVSKVASDTFEEVTGVKSEVVYNPVLDYKPKKILKLISCTRLTSEKGKDRIIKIAKELNNKGIEFIWDIYTNDTLEIKIPGIRYCKPKMNIIDYMHGYDYLVQLSDCEGYCYSVVEALCLNIPVIVTDMPVMKEIGVKDGVNGFILDFDLHNLDVQKIANNNLKFEYKPIKSDFERLLEKGERNMSKNYKVKALIKFIDIEENNTTRNINDIFLCERERFLYLEKKNAVELVEIVKEEPKKVKKDVKDKQVQKSKNNNK